MNCLNCGTKLTCGCQKKTASDGKVVCGTCLQRYEDTLKQQKDNLKKFTGK